MGQVSHTHLNAASWPKKRKKENAVLEFPKSTSRFYDALEGLMEVSKVIILTVMVYHLQGYRLKSATGEGA